MQPINHNSQGQVFQYTNTERFIEELEASDQLKNNPQSSPNVTPKNSPMWFQGVRRHSLTPDQAEKVQDIVREIYWEKKLKMAQDQAESKVEDLCLSPKNRA